MARYVFLCAVATTTAAFRHTAIIILKKKMKVGLFCVDFRHLLRSRCLSSTPFYEIEFPVAIVEHCFVSWATVFLQRAFSTPVTRSVALNLMFLDF
jgi:hypothetical protein